MITPHLFQPGLPLILSSEAKLNLHTSPHAMSDELDIDSSSHWGDVPSKEEPNEDASSQSNWDDNANSAAAEDDHTADNDNDNNGSMSDATKPAEQQPPPPATPSQKPKTRVSTLRSRTRKTGKTAAVQVEQVESVDPLGPLGGSLPSEPDNGAAPSSKSRVVSESYVKDKDSAEISKAIEHYKSNNERLALFGNEEPSKPLARDRLVGSTSRLSLSGNNEQQEEHTDVIEDAQLPVSSGVPTKPKELPPAKETFTISVGDPIKVGDLTSAHIVYTVHTKTSSPNFSKKEASVTRRYRDFRWVYHALENNNPGFIVPPPPEKQAVGRFNEDFVESRRSALERMLTKIARHPVLQNDPDFRIFLESDSFSADIKSKQYHSISTGEQPESKGFMSSLGGAFSFQSKFVETDEWFVEKKAHVDTLESQFKHLTKSLDAVIAQRKELSDSVADLSATLSTLATVELSKSFTELLERFAETELRIRDLYYRQCMQDVLSMTTTLEEYMRLLTSIRATFSQRQKAYFTLQAAEAEQAKKKSSLAKVQKSGKTLTDKLAALTDDLAAQDARVLNARVAFDDISKQIVAEVGRFEAERAVDFRDCVELFLENAVEAQKEAIEVFETFYQRSGFDAAAAAGAKKQAATPSAELASKSVEPTAAA